MLIQPTSEHDARQQWTTYHRFVSQHIALIVSSHREICGVILQISTTKLELLIIPSLGRKWNKSTMDGTQNSFWFIMWTNESKKPEKTPNILTSGFLRQCRSFSKIIEKMHYYQMFKDTRIHDRKNPKFKT
jgi:hypothetical protein